jgi:hypothetical protein
VSQTTRRYLAMNKILQKLGVSKLTEQENQHGKKEWKISLKVTDIQYHVGLFKTTQHKLNV